ncbi:D-tyrosyl-tRNA(Tyr) deacylase [bacterium]|nr:D-tyrosyl-tRNA(Tyr) deacylase [bacterium]
MKIVIQRVKSADVKVDGRLVSSIGRGFLILVGISKDDTEREVKEIAKKVPYLRIFEDENGKMNLSLKDVGGEVLSVSQFTLYADTSRGRRPGFEMAAPRDVAVELWNKFNQFLREEGLTVKEGVFGEHMEVSLINDGPVTIIMEE